jgi:uncharacterized protein (UPF0548 family)
MAVVNAGSTPVVTDAVGAAEAGGAAVATLAAVFNVAREVLGKGARRWQAAEQQVCHWRLRGGAVTG